MIKYKLLLILLLSTSSLNSAANVSCDRLMEDLGITVDKNKEANENLSLDLNIIFSDQIPLTPLFAYYSYSDRHGAFFKAPIFLDKSVHSSELNYKISTSEQSIQGLTLEIFYYPPQGIEGVYLLVSGFSDTEELACEKTVIE